jgi:hydrogenase maturation protease
VSAPAGYRVAVTALGHAYRGDDAIGILVAEALRELLPQDVPVFIDRGDALAMLDHWSDREAVVCVDACAPLGEPGRVHRLDLSVDTLPPAGAGTSSHALGLAEAVALSRALRLTPRKLIVYAIEGRCFEPGAEPTPEVAATVRSVARAVAREVACLRQTI